MDKSGSKSTRNMNCIIKNSGEKTNTDLKRPSSSRGDAEKAFFKRNCSQRIAVPWIQWQILLFSAFNTQVAKEFLNNSHMYIGRFIYDAKLHAFSQLFY